MDTASQDQRISAFLDGELPADERAEFERQMADSAELRQAVEELRAVRDSLQTLPRHKLEEDFAARVLKRAERAMLADRPQREPASAAAGSAAAGSAAAANVPAPQSAAVEAARPESYRSRRPWIWAAVTVAAAVLLMVFNPPQKNAKVAMQDKAPAGRDADNNKVAQAERANDAERAHAVESISAVPATGSLAAGPRGESRNSDAKDAEAPHNAFGPTAAAPSEQDAAKQPQAKGFGGANFAAKRADGNVADQSDGKAVAADGVGSGKAAGGKLAPKSGLAAAPLVPPKEQLPPKEQALPKEPSQHKETESLACQMKMRAADMRPALHGPPNEQIVVAEFTAARKISAAGLPALLARRGITLVQSPKGKKDKKASADKSGVESQLAGSAAALPAPQPLTKIGPAAQGGPAKSAAKPDHAAPRTEQVEVIYVEASREQVSGLLDDLRSQPATFGFVSATVAPEVPAARGPAAAAASRAAAVPHPAAVPPAANLPAATSPGGTSAGGTSAGGAGLGGVVAGDEEKNRPVPEAGKKAEGGRADGEKARDSKGTGIAAKAANGSKLNSPETGSEKSLQDFANRKRRSTEPTAYATQIDSVPPGAEELLQQRQVQQQPPLSRQSLQLRSAQQGPPPADGKDLQDRTRFSRGPTPGEQPPGAADPEPNPRPEQGDADKLPDAAPRGGGNGDRGLERRDLTNQPADRAGAAGAKSPAGRGTPAADSAFSEFDSASASGDDTPDRVQAVFVFRLGPPTESPASSTPAAPAAPASPRR